MRDQSAPLGARPQCDAADIRPCAAYELVRTAEKAEGERELLAFARGCPAVLRPREPGLASLVINDATVAFYDAVARGAVPPCEARALERLVLDRVLELRAEGRWVSGARAVSRFGLAEPAPTPDDHVGRISHDALLYGQTLRTAGVTTLAQRLYFFNRRPLSASWQHRFPSRDAVSHALGLSRGGSARRRLAPDHTLIEGPSWFRVQRRGAPSSAQYRHKLYVSPTPETLPEVFQTALQALVAHPRCTFKVAATTAGLLRPDKFLAYFATAAEAMQMGLQLQRTLDGAPVHGVPFTTSIGMNGLVSRGLDPPGSEGVGAASWRSWLCETLATALVIWRASPTDGCEPWQFALHRIALAGVDPRTWRPLDVGWDHTDIQVP